MENHTLICMTSKKLLSYASEEGSFHCDATYQIIRNGFCVYIFGITDFNHKFFPIAFAVASHEQEKDYGKFYEDLVDIFEKLELDSEPRFIVQDGSDSMLNAANNVFIFVLCVKK